MRAKVAPTGADAALRPFEATSGMRDLLQAQQSAKKSKIMIVTKQTYDYTRYRIVRPSGESLTIPDQTMSIRDIVKRYANGMPIPNIGNQLVHTGEDFEPTGFLNMDFADREDLLASKKQSLESLSAKLKKDEEEAIKADKERGTNDDQLKEPNPKSPAQSVKSDSSAELKVVKQPLSTNNT